MKSPVSIYLPQRGEVGDAALVAAEPGGGIFILVGPPPGAILASLDLLRPPRVGGGKKNVPVLGEIKV
jgi:hypothetical protein